MAKLKFDYSTPIDFKTIGTEMGPVFVINTDMMTLQGQHYERQMRLDTLEERVVTEKPIAFTIQLTQEALGQMLAAVIPLAMAQEVLRPATPAIVTPPPPPEPDPTPPPPDPEPPRVRSIPSLITVAPGESVNFDATVVNTEDVSVRWSALDGGTIDEEGIFVAPTEPGDYRVLVELVVDPTRSAISIVTVA